MPEKETNAGLLELICDALREHTGKRERDLVLEDVTETIREVVAEFAKRENVTNLLTERDELKRWSVAASVSKERISFIAIRPDGSEASLGDLRE